MLVMAEMTNANKKNTRRQIMIMISPEPSPSVLLSRIGFSMDWLYTIAAGIKLAIRREPREAQNSVIEPLMLPRLYLYKLLLNIAKNDFN